MVQRFGLPTTVLFIATVLFNLFQLPGYFDDYSTWKSWAITVGVGTIFDIAILLVMALSGVLAAFYWWSVFRFNRNISYYERELKAMLSAVEPVQRAARSYMTQFYSPPPASREDYKAQDQLRDELEGKVRNLSTKLRQLGLNPPNEEQLTY